MEATAGTELSDTAAATEIEEEELLVERVEQPAAGAVPETGVSQEEKEQTGEEVVVPIGADLAAPEEPTLADLHDAELEETPFEAPEAAGSGSGDLEYPDYIFGSDAGETAATAVERPTPPEEDLVALAERLLATSTSGARLRAFLEEIDDERVRALVSRAYAAGYMTRREESD